MTSKEEFRLTDQKKLIQLTTKMIILQEDGEIKKKKYIKQRQRDYGTYCVIDLLEISYSLSKNK